MDEKVSKGVSTLIEMLNKESKSNTARFGVVLGSGTVRLGGTACHGGLASIEGDRAVIVTAIDQPSYSHAKHPGTHKWADEYVEFLHNHSVFAPAYLGTQDGYHLVSADHPSNFVAAACVATRSVWERYGGVAQMCLALYERGIHPNLALLFANMAGFNYADGRLNAKWGRPWEDHHCLESNVFGRECVRNLYKGKVVNANKTYRESHSYHGINRMFSSYQGVGSDTPPPGGRIQDWVVNRIKNGAVQVVNTNPFPMPPPPTGTHNHTQMVSFNQAVKQLVAIYPEFLKEVGINV